MNHERRGMPAGPALLLIAATSLLAGCSAGQPATLSGEVQYQGRPIADGGIRLFPISDTPGHGAAVEIANGHYAFPPEKRLYAGQYRVEMFAARPTGRKIAAAETWEETQQGTPVDEYETYLPERFNTESRLVLELLPGANDHDFLLTGEGA